MLLLCIATCHSLTSGMLLSAFLLNLLQLLVFSPDCEWKARAGNACIASFDWNCSGICKSVERIKDVHAKCGEGDEAVWSV